MNEAHSILQLCFGFGFSPALAQGNMCIVAQIVLHQVINIFTHIFYDCTLLLDPVVWK